MRRGRRTLLSVTASRTPPLEIGVHHLAVCVADLPRAEAFYCGVLGLPVRDRWTDESGVPRSFWVDLGAGFLAVELASEDQRRGGDGGPGWHCVALRIAPADREAWREHLSRCGHPVERESAYTLYVRDPDGALLALSHHPHPA